VDFGCGSGRWVIEVGEQYPGARVYGVDISPIQPTYVPLNVEYVLMDVTEGLDFDDGSTDLVQSR
jgi:SAM-dependent methyltransferase